jgi:hypothetical protein
MKTHTGFSMSPGLIVAAVLFAAAPSARADFVFSPPVNLGRAVNTKSWEQNPWLCADGLSLLFSSDRTGGSGRFDLWATTRATTEDDWADPVNLGPQVNSSCDEYQPTVSADGLELYFTSFRPGGAGAADLWVAKRATRSGPWTAAVNLGPLINTPDHETFPRLSADGLELYFTSGPTGTAPKLSFCVTKRETKDASWTAPVVLGPPLGNWLSQFDPMISSDGLFMMFSDYGAPPGGSASRDLWFVRRTTQDRQWSLPVNAGPIINTLCTDGDPMLSADGSTLYFSSDRPGGVGYMDLWQASISPVVDFDGDRYVGDKDREILMNSWGRDEPLCDIGPLPWGDGMVNDADLAVLMRYWGQTIPEPPDPNAPLAHWKLDETEGTIASDSVGKHHGTLMGEPIWRPTGGWIDGALEFDGIDDHVEAPFVLDPQNGPFSAFAWVKGGGPEHAILSQADGSNWLKANAQGNLSTELRPMLGTSVNRPLHSEVFITDGQWHHVGLVWDAIGGARILYVDEVEVARDAVDTLWASQNSMHIGVPARLNFPHRWSGLIDDVRIYSRVVKP